MTKDFQQIVNIMTPGTGLYVLGCAHDSHIFIKTPAFLLLSIDQTD